MADGSLDLFKGTLEVLILKAVSWGPVHGYEISRWLRERSQEAFQVEEGALYPALRRLEKKGRLAAEWGTSRSGREAKFYELTSEGRSQLTAQAATWERYVVAMGRILHATVAPS